MTMTANGSFDTMANATREAVLTFVEAKRRIGQLSQADIDAIDNDVGKLRDAIEALDKEIKVARRTKLPSLSWAQFALAITEYWATPQWEETLYRALGQIKGIESDCEQHKNAPWQLPCQDCRRFVARALTWNLQNGPEFK